MKNIIIVLIVSCLLSACQKKIENVLENSQVVILSIQQHNNSTTRIEITSQDQRFILLKEWFEKNKHGWHSSPASYLQEIRVKGEDFTIDFLKDLIVVNVEGGQYVKKTKEKELDFLIKQDT